MQPAQTVQRILNSSDYYYRLDIKLRDIFKGILKERSLTDDSLIEDSDGTFTYKCVLDEDENVLEDDIKLIFDINDKTTGITSNNFIERFIKVTDEYIDEWKDCRRDELYLYIQNKVIDLYDGKDGAILDRLESLDHENILDEYLRDNVIIDLDYDQMYRQLININLIIDTGDGAHGFKLNSIGDSGKFPRRSSIKWLCEKQGHRVGELEGAYKLDSDKLKSDIRSKFIKSAVDEIKTCGDGDRALTIMLNVTLRDAVILNELIQAKNDGVVRVNRRAMVGLVNFSDGIGGPLGIVCERDMYIPIKIIQSALPDCVSGVNINKIYDLTIKDYPICKNFKILYDNMQSPYIPMTIPW